MFLPTPLSPCTPPLPSTPLTDTKYAGLSYILSKELPPSLLLTLTLTSHNTIQGFTDPDGCIVSVELITAYQSFSDSYKQPVECTHTTEESEDNTDNVGKHEARVTFPIAVRDLTVDSRVIVRYGWGGDIQGTKEVKIWDEGGRIFQGEFWVKGGGSKVDVREMERMGKSDYWLDGITRERMEEIGEGGEDEEGVLEKEDGKLSISFPVYPSPVLFEEVPPHLSPHKRSQAYLKSLRTYRECVKVLSVLREDDRRRGWREYKEKRKTLRVGYYSERLRVGRETNPERGMLTGSERKALIGHYNKKLSSSETVLMCDVVDEKEGEGTGDCEDKYRVMSREGMRGMVDTSLKPDIGQKEEIRRILARPSDYLSNSEKDLLWRFRFSLVDDKKAMCKFILSVDWRQATEVIQATELLSQWRKRAPIDITDALKLLSGSEGFRRTIVREYAVETLAGCSDAELELFLLQLVSAIKYEIFEDEDSSGEDEDEKGGAVEVPRVQVGTLGRFLIKRAMGSTNLANYLFWYLIVECEDPSFGIYYKAVFENLKSDMAKTSLETREKNSSVSERGSIAGDKSHENVFSGVFKKMTDALQGSEHASQHHHHNSTGGNRRSSDGPGTMLGLFREQTDFFMGIMEEQIKARDSKGKKAQKEAALRTNLSKYTNVSGRVGLLPVPLCPDVEVLGVKADACFMFRSALYPAVVTFRKNPDVTQLEQEVERRKEEAAKRTPTNNKKISKLLGEEKDVNEDRVVSGRKSKHIKGLVSSVVSLPPTNASTIASKALEEEYSVIFKSGDDLRQDQLIIVMIRLFDNLLKSEGLDLCLTPYSILATSPTTGLVEFVKGSMPISAVLGSFGSIGDFLEAMNPVENVERASEIYIRSCAGYCVITYILGIGDRHLDNIMLRPTGEFFHIDFGFIFGRDPKPLPPAFRLTQSMVDGFGGEEGFRKFKRLCSQTFNLLRRSAGLVINLLHLSKEGSIPDLSFHPTLTANEVIEKVEEKFRLDLNDEQAEAFFLGLIAESLGALAPRVLEVFHQIAVARR